MASNDRISPVETSTSSSSTYRPFVNGKPVPRPRNKQPVLASPADGQDPTTVSTSTSTTQPLAKPIPAPRLRPPQILVQSSSNPAILATEVGSAPSKQQPPPRPPPPKQQLRVPSNTHQSISAPEPGSHTFMASGAESHAAVAFHATRRAAPAPPLRGDLQIYLGKIPAHTTEASRQHAHVAHALEQHDSRHFVDALVARDNPFLLQKYNKTFALAIALGDTLYASPLTQKLINQLSDQIQSTLAREQEHRSGAFQDAAAAQAHFEFAQVCATILGRILETNSPITAPLPKKEREIEAARHALNSLNPESTPTDRAKARLALIQAFDPANSPTTRNLIDLAISHQQDPTSASHQRLQEAAQVQNKSAGKSSEKHTARMELIRLLVAQYHLDLNQTPAQMLRTQTRTTAAQLIQRLSEQNPAEVNFRLGGSNAEIATLCSKVGETYAFSAEQLAQISQAKLSPDAQVSLLKRLIESSQMGGAIGFEVLDKATEGAHLLNGMPARWILAVPDASAPETTALAEKFTRSVATSMNSNPITMRNASAQVLGCPTFIPLGRILNATVQSIPTLAGILQSPIMTAAIAQTLQTHAKALALGVQSGTISQADYAWLKQAMIQAGHPLPD